MLRLRDLWRELLAVVVGPDGGRPGLFWAAVALSAAVLAAVAARYAVRREALPRRRAGAPLAAGDAWTDAETAARAGRYDVAAQRLYAAVVSGLARAGLVRAHASKTAGDYLRELRRAHERQAHAFAPFARGYQAVVYGPRAVDRERYEALRASALPLLDRPLDGTLERTGP